MNRCLLVGIIAFGLLVKVVKCIDCEIVSVSTTTQLSASSSTTRKYDFTVVFEIELNEHLSSSLNPPVIEISEKP